MIDHLITEGSSDIEGVMKTVSPKAEFRHPDGKRSKGHAEIRPYYEGLFAQGGIGNLAISEQRIILDDDAAVNEVLLSSIVPWDMAKARGYDIHDEHGHYAIRRPICTTMPFDQDGLLGGEISYLGPFDPGACEKVPDAALSPGYLAWYRALPR